MAPLLSSDPVTSSLLTKTPMAFALPEALAFALIVPLFSKVPRSESGDADTASEDEVAAGGRGVDKAAVRQRSRQVDRRDVDAGCIGIARWCTRIGPIVPLLTRSPSRSFSTQMPIASAPSKPDDAVASIVPLLSSAPITSSRTCTPIAWALSEAAASAMIEPLLSTVPSTSPTSRTPNRVCRTGRRGAAADRAAVRDRSCRGDRPENLNTDRGRIGACTGERMDAARVVERARHGAADTDAKGAGRRPGRRGGDFTGIREGRVGADGGSDVDAIRDRAAAARGCRRSCHPARW